MLILSEKALVVRIFQCNTTHFIPYILLYVYLVLNIFFLYFHWIAQVSILFPSFLPLLIWEFYFAF